MDEPKLGRLRDDDGRIKWPLTLTQRQYSARMLEAEHLGFQGGLEHAREALREEIRSELADELLAQGDPDCPMCALGLELERERRAVRRLRLLLDDTKARHRSERSRAGRYPYRQTRKGAAG